jgi:nicotinamide phosphoribosyltransferase
VFERIADPFDNLITLTDSYKIGHWKQYPDDTEYIYSYLESRGGAWQNVVFFGLQYYCKRYLCGQVITKEKIDEAEEICNAHFGRSGLFNRAMWEHILNKHGGHLPIEIKAVPEGLVVPGHNVLMTVRNTDPLCAPLTNYLETILTQIWYGCTVATQSREMKYLLEKYLKKTGGIENIDFKLHDFGFRGVSSVETAGVGGAAHLVNFKGTDTMAGILVARKAYGESMAGFSIPAAEHSTITSWGREQEADAMENMLNAYPTGLVAVVSDSFNIFDACENIWGGKLKDRVLGREGTLVVRPDSGDPIEVLCKGQRNVMDILGAKFGFTVNKEGYRVLDPHVRVIQGDGIDFSSLDNILYAFQQKGWSADNLAFGSGGGLLQKLNRDTLKFAFKCAAITRSGLVYPVFKDPITDHGKQSKSGYMKLIKQDFSHASILTTVPQDATGADWLRTVFKDGELLVDHPFSDIRERAALTPVLWSPHYGFGSAPIKQAT